MVKIAVSILSKNDDETIAKLNNTNLDYYHLDIMDGIFVKEIYFPLSKIKEISHKLHHKLDVHLMVQDYDYYINNLHDLNIEYITIHYETLNNIDVIKKIKSKGIKCGLSIKPNTDIKDIFPLLDNLDLVLIMSVEPGYGGQEFIISSLDKVRLLKEEINKRNLKTIISIDGGINNVNAASCIEAGCDMLVSGSYIIKQDDYQKAIDILRK